MNAIRWIGRKLFYTETLADRQLRKLGAIDTERAKLHNNDETPILVRDPNIVFFEPPIGLPKVEKKVVYKQKKRKKGKK